MLSSKPQSSPYPSRLLASFKPIPALGICLRVDLFNSSSPIDCCRIISTYAKCPPRSDCCLRSVRVFPSREAMRHLFKSAISPPDQARIEGPSAANHRRASFAKPICLAPNNPRSIDQMFRQVEGILNQVNIRHLLVG